MLTDAVAGFVDKWLQREPWHRLLLLFQPPAQRQRVQLVEAIGHELRSAALAGSDPAVVAGKLAWWAQDLARIPDGNARHPLTVALATGPHGAVDVGACREWAAAAVALAQADPAIDLAARLRPWRAFCQAQAAAVDLGDRSDGIAHALVLLTERLPLARQDLAQQRLPVPLTSMAALGATRDALSGDARALSAVLREHAIELDQALAAAGTVTRYRRGQAALAHLRLRGVIADRTGSQAAGRPLPALRSALAVWRASHRS